MRSLKHSEESRKATSCCLHASLLLIYFSMAWFWFLITAPHCWLTIAIWSSWTQVSLSALLVPASLVFSSALSVQWFGCFHASEKLGLALLILTLMTADACSGLFHSGVHCPCSNIQNAPPASLQGPFNWFFCHYLFQLWAQVGTVMCHASDITEH